MLYCNTVTTENQPPTPPQVRNLKISDTPEQQFNKFAEAVGIDKDYFYSPIPNKWIPISEMTEVSA